MFFKKQIDYEKILLKYVDSDFYLVACGKDAPSYDTLKIFEKKHSIKLPEEFKAFSVSPLGGIYIDIKDDIWPRPKPLEVGSFWSFLYGFAVFGFAIDISDWMNIENQANKFKEQTNNNYIPFMKVIGDSDLYCFDGKGLIYQWDHELDLFKKIDKSFNELLEYEISELKLRKDRKVKSSS
ncbi:SMI1-KNR4 cell-wall [Mucilaginibacter mallensis]|uniref:SMI1-KNR4 cell-wall n=1 Tax=Mucilaginibacter mallensis TaxID=652787 RepID=A0A1H2C7B8_MUCMA|nr:SMI1/KNR4 family protein [Mucilaginibacter mallensis]SDT65986.1 SMI1-KNR4 cell-wall [Mucilaginibacter mallensis]